VRLCARACVYALTQCTKRHSAVRAIIGLRRWWRLMCFDSREREREREVRHERNSNERRRARGKTPVTIKYNIKLVPWRGGDKTSPRAAMRDQVIRIYNNDMHTSVQSAGHTTVGSRNQNVRLRFGMRVRRGRHHFNNIRLATSTYAVSAVLCREICSRYMW